MCMRLYIHIRILKYAHTYTYLSVAGWPAAPSHRPLVPPLAPPKPPRSARCPENQFFPLTQMQMHIALRPLCANHCGYFKTPMPNTYVEVLRLSLNEVMRFIANGAIANACGDDAGDNVCFCFPVFLPSSLFPLSTSVSSAARSTCFVESLSAFGRSEAP